MPASGILFSGEFVKTLKSQLKLRDTARILTGTQDPRFVATDGEEGSILLQQGSGGQIFIKNDNGSTTNWSFLAQNVSNSTTDILETIKNQMVSSNYSLATPSIFGLDGDSLIDSFGGTAAMSPTGDAVAFPAPGDSITSVQLLDKEAFLENDIRRSDISKATAVLFWKNTSIDLDGTTEISRDGGAHYYPMTMTPTEPASEVYTGDYEWKIEEEIQASSSYAVNSTSSALTDIAGTTTAYASSFLFAVNNDTQIRINSVSVKISRLGSPVGSYRIAIYSDTGGLPDAALYTADWRSVAAVPTSATDDLFLIPNFLVPDNATYHLVLETDAAYKASYTGGNNLRFHRSTVADTGVESQFDGTSWTAFASVKFNRVISYSYEQFSLLNSDTAATTSGLNLDLTNKQIARQFTIPADTDYVIKRTVVKLKRTLNPVGNVLCKIVKDNGSGLPSTSVNDILGVSNIVAASSISTSEVDTNFYFSNVVLGPGEYHLVVAAEDTYINNFIVGNFIEVRNYTGAVTTSTATFNGTIWTEATNTIHTYFILQGRLLDLRLRVTSGTASNRNLAAFAVFYKPEIHIVQGIKNVDTKQFLSLTDNTNVFTLNFTPDTDLLEVWHIETGKAYKYPAFQVADNIITFPVNQFNDSPDETVTLKFMQTKGYSYDSSNANALAIADLQDQIDNLGSTPTTGSPDDTFVVLSKIAAPNTVITNRALMVDLTQDMRPRHGIERFHFSDLVRLPKEYGPNGNFVYKPVNDRFDMVRAVGPVFIETSDPFTYGVTLAGVQSSNSFIEISFYGTGLNLLSNAETTNRILDVSIDGAADVSINNANSATGLSSLGHNRNVIIQVATGLTQGLHTVKIKPQSLQFYLSGYEVVNANATAANIRVNGGTYSYKGALRTSTTTNLSYNSGFETVIGTPGSAGGRVSIYQKSDGTIAHGIRYNTGTGLFLASADHTNETISEEKYVREFGEGFVSNSTDFACSTTPAVAGNKIQTGTDGGSALFVRSVTFGRQFNGNTSLGHTAEALLINTNALKFSFIGTGLDIELNSTVPGGNTFRIKVDDNAGSVIPTITVSNSILKVVSGLRYGHHTVSIVRESGSSDLGIKKFITYVPSKPTLPADAVELGSYGLMSNLYLNSTANQLAISSGVIRKVPSREFVLEGTMAYLADNTTLDSQPSGTLVTSSSAGATYQFVFWGTGFEVRGKVDPAYANSIIAINGLTLTTANFPTVAANSYGGMTFNTGTGSLSWSGGTADGAGATIFGLPLGLYKVRITTSTSLNMRLSCIDVITPIHEHKQDYNYRANNFRIGSESVGDSRAFEPAYKANTGFLSATTASDYTLATGPTIIAPFPGLSATIKATGKPVQISYSIPVTIGPGFPETILHTIAVDGVPIERRFNRSNIPSNGGDIAASTILYLEPGQYHIGIIYQNQVAASFNVGNGRFLTIKELD